MSSSSTLETAEICVFAPIPKPRIKQRKPLGQILVENGDLSADDKWRTLEMQASVNAKLGEILLAHNLVEKDQLIRAIAQQFETDVADLTTIQPDIELIEKITADRCLAEGILPCQVVNDVTIIATSRPEMFHVIKPELETAFGALKMEVTSEVELHKAIQRREPKTLLTKAETRLPLENSCRTWTARSLPIVASIAGFVVLAGLFFIPTAVFLVTLCWAVFTLVAQTILKIAAWIAQVHAERLPHSSVPKPPPSRLPIVSILVPLYKERKIAGRLVERLSRLDYPSELLDICLVVESDDQITRAAIDAVHLPSTMRRIIVPAAPLKTKPRALNYALDFCRGTIVGVYDAEDAPDPDQIRRIAERFHQAPPEVVCLQGILDYYNTHTNWISRCFTIEYATWFRLILPGLMRLGLVIPLGGTTLFFRRNVLEEIGGWDAHNVTEDADLGIRLARNGYRAELIQTVTSEEANCRVWPWVKQRSRWLKGYAVTWAVHNRRPWRLWQDLGAWRFFGVQLLLLGTLTQFAVAPLLWSFWLITFSFGLPMHTELSSSVIWALAGIFFVSEAVSIGARIHAVKRTHHKRLMRWVPSLYFYFPLATLASYKAGFELLTRPFYWDKTSHGDFDVPSPQSPAEPSFKSHRHQV